MKVESIAEWSPCLHLSLCQSTFLCHRVLNSFKSLGKSIFEFQERILWISGFWLSYCYHSWCTCIFRDMDTQLAVVFIANASNDRKLRPWTIFKLGLSSDKSAHLCSLARALATRIQNINTSTVNPFLHVRRAWNDMSLLKLLFASPYKYEISWTSNWFPASWLFAFALTSLNVSQYVGIDMCHRECLLIT